MNLYLYDQAKSQNTVEAGDMRPPAQVQLCSIVSLPVNGHNKSDLNQPTCFRLTKDGSNLQM